VVEGHEANAPPMRTRHQVGDGSDRTATVRAHGEVAAIVQQKIAAASPLLVAQDAAFDPSLDISGRVGLPVARIHVPQDGGEAQLGEHAEDAGMPRSEGWPEEANLVADGVFDERGGLADLCPDALETHVHQPGMGHGMAAHGVAGAVQRAHDLRPLPNELTDDEEGGGHLVTRQDFEELAGVRIVWPVVEGERHLRWIKAGDQRTAEDLRRRPQRRIVISADCKGACGDARRSSPAGMQTSRGEEVCQHVETGRGVHRRSVTIVARGPFPQRGVY
jgi:hypothetical protein